MGFPSGLAVKNLPAMQEPQEMQVRPLGQEDPLDEGVATHSSVSCLENPMDRGAWRAVVHRVAESDTLKQLSTHALVNRTAWTNFENILLGNQGPQK